MNFVIRSAIWQQDGNPEAHAKGMVASREQQGIIKRRLFTAPTNPSVQSVAAR
jgi:hypothetical protein